MKKIVSTLIAFVLLMQMVFGAGFFFDVDEATPQGEAIIKMADRGIVDGIGGGYFNPEGKLTRSQFVKIVNNVFGYTQAGENKFTDVKEGAWYYDHVRIGVEAGYIQGIGNGLFAPEDLVSREQACVILNNILKMELLPYYKEPKDAVSSWAKEAVLKAISNGLVSLEEGERFRAQQPMTRAEACEVLAKCLVDVDPVPKIDLNQIAEEDLNLRINRVISAMENKVIPELSNEKSKQISRKIVENMRLYLADKNHDYKKASEETFAIYKTIPKNDREIFKDKIQKYNTLEDLLILYDFFFIV
ncbi:MAG: S-layer homology domain-containing protein [Clostridia bacterium]|nr:S-layer homology domain-containing protein [Clostridia bacterium]